MADLTAPSGAKVKVADERVESLLRYGFTQEKAKAPAKKAASSGSEK